MLPLSCDNASKTLELTLEPNTYNKSVRCHLLHACSCKLACCIRVSLNTLPSLSNLRLSMGPAAALEPKLLHQRLLRVTVNQ